MNLNRRLIGALLIAALSCSIFPLAAQDAPTAPEPSAPGGGDPSAPAAEKTAEPASKEKKRSFWGDRFALYLEAGGGTGTAATLDSSVSTSPSRTTKNLLDLDLLIGTVGVGWQLPDDRGSFRLEFSGFSEDSSTFRAYGNLQAVAGPRPGTPNFNPTWWTIVSSGGSQTTTFNPPSWTDTNGDLAIQRDELVYSASPVLSQRTTAPENFQNRLQTFDMLFYRDFGGRVWSSRYSCGLRYLIFDGNLPAGAWISTTLPTAGGGFTDGTTLPLLYVREKTSGIGPTGSLELHYNLFRKRLILFGQARFAFVLQSTDADSGAFSTLVFDGTQSSIFTAPARIQTSVSEAVWNIGGRFGASVRIVDGFRVDLFYDQSVYHHAVQVPFEILVPGSRGQISQGTSALFNSQNLDIKSVRLTAGFQF